MSELLAVVALLVVIALWSWLAVRNVRRKRERERQRRLDHLYRATRRSQGGGGSP